ncbi:MAG: hypothetical protein ABI333_30520 [bacterium]
MVTKAAAIIGALAMCAACEGVSPGGTPDANVPGDAALRDVEQSDTAIVDAQPDADPVDAMVYPHCDVPIRQPQVLIPGELIQLPPVEQTEFNWLDWNGRHVVYSLFRCPPEMTWIDDLFVFDLETMQESVVAARVGGQSPASVSADGVVFMDSYFLYFPTPDNDRRFELYHYDFDSAQETRLTNANWPKLEPEYNGTHVAYLSGEWDPQQVLTFDLVLRELSTGQEVLLADHDQYVRQCFSISDEYVTWQANYSSQPYESDIFFHHIPTGITDRMYLNVSQQICPHVSGSRVSWIMSTYGNQDIYVYNITTGIQQRLTTDPDVQFATPIEGHLLLSVDYRHGTVGTYDRDLYIYDLDTGAHRRLTVDSLPWGALRPSCRWMIYSQHYSTALKTLYAWDLVAAGVLDQSCHVIPCDPLTEMCQTLEWRGP